MRAADHFSLKLLTPLRTVVDKDIQRLKVEGAQGGLCDSSATR